MEPRVFTRITESRDAAIEYCMGAIDDKLADFSASQLPAGAIFPFSGLFGGPENKHPVDPYTKQPNVGFALCDGGAYSAPGKPSIFTPDLRGRFILASGASHPTGETGGSENQVTGATTLTTAQMPSHGHTLDCAGGLINSYTGDFGAGLHTAAYRFLKTTPATGGGGSHTHGVSALPPYYSLAYIMKL